MSKIKKKRDKSIFLLGLIIIILAAVIVFGYFQLRTDPLTEKLKQGADYAILFAVAGDKDYGFFEVFLYHPGTHKGAVIFIPGNVGTIIESLKRVDRADVLYKAGKLEEFKRKVEELIGIEIDFTVDLNENGVKDLVDLLGGLELFIPNPVDLKFDNRHILLPSGSVVLDGDKIVDFIAYEDSLETEIDLVARKQKFLQALLKRIGQREAFLLKPDPFKALKSIFISSFSARSLDSFVAEMKNFVSERLIFQRVLGSRRTVDQQVLLFPHFEGDLLKETVKQTQETIAKLESISEEEMTITMEILNGTETNGLARRAANVFQSFGYDIAGISNADSNDYLKTIVIDRKGKLEGAQKAADLIRCSRVYSRFDESVDPTIDVTLILGKDFDGRVCKE